MDDRTVLFEAGHAGPPFLEKNGVGCEFKVNSMFSTIQLFTIIHVDIVLPLGRLILVLPTP